MPGALGICVDVLDIAAERLALLLEPLDSFDNAPQTVGRDATHLGVVNQFPVSVAIIEPPS